MIYFDNAASSRYRPKAAIEAALKEFCRPANPGRSGHNDAVEAALTVHKAREAVKALINNYDAEVVFTKNCTEALNLAIQGTARQGHVITTVMEHNSVLRPLFELQKCGQIRLSVLDCHNGSVNLSELEKKICPDTYLVAVTAMSNVTGYVTNVAEIGKITSQQGIILLVDGAQSLGHIPFDMRSLGCDMVACSGQKGLHGAQGAGFLCYTKRLKIKPLIFGGTGTESSNTYQPRIAPESLESGTLNTIGIAALAEGIYWTLQNFQKIRQKVQEISKYFFEELSKISGLRILSDVNSGIISFDLDGYSSAQIADILNDKYNVAVRSGLHCAPLIHNALGTSVNGLTRISIGYNNTLREAKKTVLAIKSIAASRTVSSPPPR